MKQLTSLIAILLLFSLGGNAQTPGRHALFLGIGGAGRGIGPVYEWMAISRAPVGIGLSMGLPLLHQRWLGNVYSPVSFSPGMSFVFGRRALRMEVLAEYNHFFEKGISDYSIVPPLVLRFRVNTLALMAGVRWQVADSRWLLRADVGLADQRYAGFGRLIPCGYAMAGYRFGGSKPAIIEPAQSVMPCDTRGERLRKQMQIQFAPYAAVSAYGLRKQLDNYALSGTLFPLAYTLPVRWNGQVGLQADFSKRGSALGLRLAVGVGLRALRYDWSIAGIEPITQAAFGRHVHIDDLQMVMHLSPRLRIRTAGQRPWVFQAGLDAGFARTVNSHSYIENIPIFWEYESPNPLSYQAAPIVLISKRFPLGNHFLEPTVQGTWSLRPAGSFPGFKTWSAGAGVALWLGKAPQ